MCGSFFQPLLNGLQLWGFPRFPSLHSHFPPFTLLRSVLSWCESILTSWGGTVKLEETVEEGCRSTPFKGGLQMRQRESDKRAVCMWVCVRVRRHLCTGRFHICNSPQATPQISSIAVRSWLPGYLLKYAKSKGYVLVSQFYWIFIVLFIILGALVYLQ